MRNHKRTRATLALTLCALLLSACATNQSGSNYHAGQAQHEMSVRLGVVESVRSVSLEAPKSGAGGLAGGVLGGILGSNIGGGNRGSAVGTIVGAIGGTLAGHAIEDAAGRKPGLEITVKLENGNLVAITQEADEQFSQGQRVRVLSDGRSTRVTH